MALEGPPLELHSPLSVFRGDAVLCAFLAVGTLTFLATYALSYTVDSRRLLWPYIFLSETIDYAPSSCIGSFLLSPACALMAVVVLLRKEQLAAVTPPQTCWWLGALGAFGGHGVASFQVHNAPSVHFSFAGVFFGATSAYVVRSVWHERVHSAPTRSDTCALVRLASAVLTPLLILGALALAPFIAAAVAAGEHVDLDGSGGSGGGRRVSALIALLAALEILTYLNLAAHFASLLPELRCVQMGFKVVRTGGDYPIGDGTLDEPFVNYIANST